MMIKRQSYDFAYQIFGHIYYNANGKVMAKLYQCCKYIYFKFGNIIKNLEIVDDDKAEIFSGPLTVIPSSDPSLPNIKDLPITESFLLNVESNGLLIPTFSQCLIKKLILRESIFWKEYLTLTKARTIEELSLKQIYDPIPKNFVSVEDLLLQVPNAKIIRSVFSRSSFSQISLCK